MKCRRAGARQGEKRKNNRKGSAEGDSGSILRCSKRTGLAVASVRHGWLLQNKSTPTGVRFLFRLLKREASTRKFALRAREIRLAAASQAGGRSAANLRTGLAFASECKRPTWVASPKQKHPCWGAFVLEAPPGIGPGIKVLQTSALPLGYGALSRIQKNVCSIYKKNERGVHSFF